MEKQRTLCVVDLDGDDDFEGDVLEVQGLSKGNGWVTVVRVKANEFGFGPDEKFYYRVFRVIHKGHLPQSNVSDVAEPAA